MLPMLRNRVAPLFAGQPLLTDWSDLRREIDRLFEGAVPGGFPGSAWIPAMDVEETGEVIRLSFDVPGVDPSNLHVTIENSVLTVSGEKRLERDTENGGSGTERRYGRFERSVTLPQSVDADKVSARCEHGVLTIELPKTARARPRTIQIAAGSDAPQLGSGKSGKRDAA